MPIVPFIEGLMPLQLMLELLGLVLLFSVCSYFLDSLGFPINRFFKAITILGTAFFYLKYRVYPPLPFSVLITYTTVVFLAVLLWASSSEDYWQEFKRPILMMLDAETPRTRIARMVVLLLLPFLAGWVAWSAMQVEIAEPIELRTVIPAPHSKFKAFGIEYVTAEVRNPFRVNAQGQYDQRYTDALSAEENGAGLLRLGADPWAPEVSGYLQYVREGGGLYFQNCFYCHGANLDAGGPQNYASNPLATNFKQIRTVMFIDEGHSFLRTAGGGPSLPNEGFPWASVMPPMEEHLTADEIWKALLFKSWFTGGDPAWVYRSR